MLTLKHLKTLQHVSIIIHIIFKELYELPEDDLNNDRNMIERFLNVLMLTF